MRRRSRLFYNRNIKWEKDPIIHKNKNKIKKKEANKQTNKNRPLPRNRISILTGTALALQCSTQCGEILSLLVASRARTARKSCTQIMRKTDLYGQNMTFPQKPCCFIKLCYNSAAFRCTFSLL